MNILVTGSSGLVGTALVRFLTRQGHRVVCITRAQSANANQIYWNPSRGILDPKTLEGCDAVVHLAGENISARRWTAEQERRIRESRVLSTKLLVTVLSELPSPPEVLVSASAIGYYGDRGSEILEEDSKPGSNFLASVCCEWEAATKPAEQAGIRVVVPRIGVVLSRTGGALAAMITPFRLGVGGRIGSGAQYMSWIALEDLVGIIDRVIHDKSLAGAINAVTPFAVTNIEFTRALGRVLARPAIFPIPAFALRVLLGRMADELLLASTRVKPARLLAAGHEFRHPYIEEALHSVLKQK